MFREALNMLFIYYCFGYLYVVSLRLWYEAEKYELVTTESWSVGQSLKSLQKQLSGFSKLINTCFHITWCNSMQNNWKETSNIYNPDCSWVLARCTSFSSVNFKRLYHCLVTDLLSDRKLLMCDRKCEGLRALDRNFQCSNFLCLWIEFHHKS